MFQWPARVYELRDRWFRPGPRSMLWVDPARCRAGRVVVHIRYCCMDFGMYYKRKKRVSIMQMSRDSYVVNRKLVCDLDGLERACFERMYEECLHFGGS